MKKLAIILAKPVRGAAFDELLQFVTSVSRLPDAPELVFAFPEQNYETTFVAQVRQKLPGVQIRGFTVEAVTRKYVRGFFGWRDDYRSSLFPLPEYVRPRDGSGGFDFMDCDFWFFWNAPGGRAIASLRPYALRLDASLTRMTLPTAAEQADGRKAFERSADIEFLAHVWSHRLASFNFAATPRGVEELVSAHGVPRAATGLMPALEPAALGQPTRGYKPNGGRPYILIPLLEAMEPDLIRIAEVAEWYIAEYGGTRDLVFLGELGRKVGPIQGDITARVWQKQDEKTQVEFEPARFSGGPNLPFPYGAFRGRIGRWKRMHQTRLKFYSDMDSALRRDLVAGASQVWLPSLRADRDYLSVEAARRSIPVLGPSHPFLAERARQYGIRMHTEQALTARDCALRLIEIGEGRGPLMPALPFVRTPSAPDLSSVLGRLKEFVQ